MLPRSRSNRPLFPDPRARLRKPDVSRGNARIYGVGCIETNLIQTRVKFTYKELSRPVETEYDRERFNVGKFRVKN